MKLVLTSRWEDKLEFEWKGNLITTLRFANDYTLENDISGYFFEMENADQKWLKSVDCDVPFFMNSYGDIIAPVEYSIIEETEERLK